MFQTQSFPLSLFPFVHFLNRNTLFVFPLTRSSGIWLASASASGLQPNSPRPGELSQFWFQVVFFLTPFTRSNQKDRERAINFGRTLKMWGRLKAKILGQFFSFRSWISHKNSKIQNWIIFFLSPSFVLQPGSVLSVLLPKGNMFHKRVKKGTKK